MVVAASYHIMSKYPILYEFFAAFEAIETNFQHLSLIVNTVEQRYYLLSVLSRNYNGSDATTNRNIAMMRKKYEKLKLMDAKAAVIFIKHIFASMRSILNKLETSTLKMVANIVEKYDTNNQPKAIMLNNSGDNENEDNNNNNDQQSKNSKKLVENLELAIKASEKEQDTNEADNKAVNKTDNEAGNEAGKINSNIDKKAENGENTMPMDNESHPPPYSQTSEKNEESNPKNERKDIVAGGNVSVSTGSDIDEKEEEESSGTETIYKVKLYVSKQMRKHDLSNASGFVSFLKMCWHLRSIMLSIVSHFFDTATDIALVMEFYILRENKSEYDYLQDVDMNAMFLCSLAILFYYRISSSFEVFRFSQNKFDTICQFLFDFYLIKLVYVSLFKLKTYKKADIIKVMRGIEGSNESGYQAVLTMVFLLKTNFEGTSSIIAIISLVFSYLSLVQRFIVLDYYYLKANANRALNSASVDFISNIGDLIENICINGVKFLNIWFFYHYFFRMLEVTFSILLLALMWQLFGGLWLGIIVFIFAFIVVSARYYAQGVFSTDYLKDVFSFRCVHNM